MLRRSMHAWRSTWLLHTRAVLLQVVLVSELARSLACSLHLRHLFLLPKHLHSQDAMLIDGVTTKPRLKQASRDRRHTKSAGRQRAICSWQVAATNSHNLSGSLATRFFFFYFSPSHFCCCCGCICMHQQIQHWELALWHNNRIFQCASRLSQRQYSQSTLHIC